MKTTLRLLLHCHRADEGRWRMSAFAETGERVAALDLKLALFATDRDSFFGAFVDTWETDSEQGVQLTAAELLDFLIQPPINPLVEADWGEALLDLREQAMPLRDALMDGRVVPSYEAWLAGRIEWRVDEPGFAALPYAPLLQQLLQDAMAEKLAHDERKRQAVERMRAWTSERPPEREWLYTIGWLEDRSPMQPALRLTEPKAPGPKHAWRLEYALLDRGDARTVVVCDDGGQPLSALPPDWADGIGRAQAAFALWLSHIPAIAAEGDPPKLRSSLSDAEAWTFLTEHSGRIAEWGGAVMLPAWWERLRRQRPQLRAHVRMPAGGEPAMLGLDHMLQFDWRLSIDGVELNEEQVQALARSQQQLHYIDGRWISLDSKLAEQIRKVVDKSKRKPGLSLRDMLHRHLAGEQDAPRGEAAAEPEEAPLLWELQMEHALEQWMLKLTRDSGMPEFAAPASFRGALRGYQSEGVAWLLYLRQFGFGACLADDMGLGKTVQYIAYLLHMKEHEPSAGPSLLICPTSLIGNWQKELERFAPALNIYLHYGAHRDKQPGQFADNTAGCDLVLTTYMTALLDIESLAELSWNSLCLDEAQNIKNAYTKQSSAIRRIAAQQRIAMTGTPGVNRRGELWSIFDFINPGYLGGPGQFQRKYARELERSSGSEASGQVRGLIRPFMLRRMKTDPSIVPDLPGKLESKVYVPLTSEQAGLYESVLDDLLRRVGSSGGMDRRGAILAALTRLKQICDHPALYIKEHRSSVPSAARSHKTARLVEMIRELRADGDRCLVFSQYAEMGALLQRLLAKELKEPVLYLHGGTPKAERDRLVASFQNEATGEQPGVFVLSLKAGGTGLNLTAANHVFHIDRWWNPAVENQATDRAYRIGQNRRVQVYKFISLGTLEERIDDMIEKKIGLSDNITGSAEQWMTELSRDELQELFTLRREWLEE